MTATLAQPAADRRSVPAGDAVVQCLKLTKVFRDFWMRPRVRAVDAIDFDIRRGEVFGLLGPNGSGKSTTIKMILGLLHATAGQVLVFGKRPDDVAIKKRIGYLPEESYLYRFLSARETLDYYGKLFHQDRAVRRKRIDMLLNMVGLEGAQRRPVGEFSKGMQRRIGLAQALINDPEFLILDEPTTGLDPIGTRQIKDLILELARRGKTILLCSHLLADVEDVCDRVSIMFGGKVHAHGTVHDLLVQSDTTTIQTPTLDVETISEIEQVLERKGKCIERIEQPRQKLEDLFLDIVAKAQSAGVKTSGATSGGEIAQFLTAEGTGEDVIDRLMQPSPAPPLPEPAAPAPVPIASEGSSRAVLDELLREEAPPPPPPSQTRATPRQERSEPADDVDTSVIDDLLGGGKKG
jgi:ABC-2 type transport system ATP-binding protein